MNASLLALVAIALWGGLATLGVRLSSLPPFWLTGVALCLGSVIALPLSGFDLRRWRVPLRTLALGVYGLFGFHFLLFIALRHAPAVQANLVNYLWPLGMVVMAPLCLRGVRWHSAHGMAALLGFAGAALAITGRNPVAVLDGGLAWGYVPALGSALVWATYSLWTQRVPAFDTSAIGLFALVSGLLSLLCHVALEPPVDVQAIWQGPLLWPLLLMGLGPLGAAFFLWDAALKRGDAQQIGLLSFITPVLSTVLLLWSQGQALHWSLALATAMIVGAALWGRRVR